MSITFSGNCTVVLKTSTREPCLCAQLAERFHEAWCAADEGDPIAEDLKENLRSHANSSCPSCKGSGIEEVVTDDRPEVNYSNGNAHLLLEVLGLEAEPCGSMTIPEARRAVMRGRSRRDLSDFERPSEVEYGPPRDNGKGVVELRPLRFLDVGLSSEDLRRRVDCFSALVEESAKRGATEISWG